MASVHVFDENMHFRLPAGLNRVTNPVLVLVGQREFKIMQQSARDVAAAIPGAKGFQVANAIHFWSMQLPDLFTQTVRNWIEDRALPPELTPLQ